MNVEHINPFIKATVDVLSQLGSLSPNIGKMFVKNDPAPTYRVAVIIGVVGDVKGQVIYSFSEETAKMVASAMMMGMPVDVFDEMAKSAVSELANMISGHAMTGISEFGLNVDISPPTLVCGESVKISSVTEKIVVVPVELGDEEIELNISLKGA